MNDLPVQWGDILVIGVLALSGVLAFARGFTKEVLSIGGWLAAGLVTLYVLPLARPFTRQYITEHLMADFVTGLVVFVISLFVFSLLAGAISQRVQDSAVGALDRSLGFLFGVARGIVVLALAYLVMLQFVAPDRHPDWINQARALPSLQWSANLLHDLAPTEIAEGLRRVEDVSQAASEALEGQQAIQDLTKTLQRQQQAPDDSGGETGYKKDQRQELNRVLPNVQAN